MHKIIFDTFEFDLTPYKISTVEDNQWFSDQFFTKYSFPFNFKLTDELINVFGDLLDDNSKFIQTIYEVKYVFGNLFESCVFEIESQVGKEIEATFRYGFDELPNYDKKLSELPLEVVEAYLINDIYAHAKAIIQQKWPAVNYNYPQIFTEKYDITQKTWENFDCLINNYVDDEFLTNTETIDGFINRNIIQPLPYLLHVLTQGFLDVGFTLKGDILTNSLFKKILIYVDKDYFVFGGDIRVFNLYQAYYNDEYDELTNYVEDSISLEPDSTYKITGKIYLNINYPDVIVNQGVSTTAIEYKGNALAQLSTINTDLENQVKEVDITLTTDSVTGSFQKLDVISIVDKNDILNGLELFDLIVEKQISDSAAEVKIYADMNLKRAVPDATFGNLLTELKKYFNIEINPVNKDIYMDFIEDQINYDNAIDLTNKEILKPKKEFNKLDSILLKFNEADNNLSSFTPVFQDRNKVSYSEIEVNDSTKKIEVDIFPLPQKTKNTIQTASNAYLPGESKIQFVLYDGLQNDLNTTIANDELLLPNVHNKYHKKIYNFRLTATQYAWLFKMYAEKLATINKKVFAYGRYHIVKSLEKTQISKDLFEVEIETETLE